MTTKRLIHAQTLFTTQLSHIHIATSVDHQSKEGTDSIVEDFARDLGKVNVITFVLYVSLDLS
jgi:hypothetical protein